VDLVVHFYECIWVCPHLGRKRENCKNSNSVRNFSMFCGLSRLAARAHMPWGLKMGLHAWVQLGKILQNWWRDHNIRTFTNVFGCVHILAASGKIVKILTRSEFLQYFAQLHPGV
jgi:hypothetical protein